MMILINMIIIVILMIMDNIIINLTWHQLSPTIIIVVNMIIIIVPKIKPGTNHHHCPNFRCWCCSFGFATGRTHLFPLTPQSQSHHHCHKDVNFCKYLKLKAENTILCLSIVIALLPKPITNGQSSQCEQNMRHRSLSTGIVQVQWGLFLDRHRGELASLPLAKLVREGEKRKCMQ